MVAPRATTLELTAESVSPVMETRASLSRKGASSSAKTVTAVTVASSAKAEIDLYGEPRSKAHGALRLPF